jgi:16S rRNA G966 N2-methylase RsmD
MDYLKKVKHIPKHQQSSENNPLTLHQPLPKYTKYNYQAAMDTNKTKKSSISLKSTTYLKKLIFPPIADDKINKLMIDDDSIKFITYASPAHEITNIIMKNVSDFPCPKICSQSEWNAKSLCERMKCLTISEMTAGVGGNVLSFANYFKYVNAIEIDKTRYNYLNKNIKLYGFTNVNCYNADSLELLVTNDIILQDIIFFDPPWGGKNYKIHTKLRLQFGKYTIENVCKVLLEKSHNKMVILKLPNNYDIDYITEVLQEYFISKFFLSKMTIIVVKNYKTVR